MKRIICMLLTLCLILGGCSAGTDTQGEAVFTFTDDLGREVRLMSEPKRVACLLGSFADVWTLAGGTVIAAPDDAWEDFGLAMEGATVLGSAKSLSLELLLAAEPDFILASANTRQQLGWLDTLEATGIPTAYFNVSGFRDYLGMLKICTDITGRADLYEQNGTAVQAGFDGAVSYARQKISESGQAPTVLCLRLAASGIRVKNSRDNVLGELLASLGCVNIADSDTVLLENLSMEHILLADPDCIFLVQQGDDDAGAQAALDTFIGENPGWQTLTAVREGRVHTLDKRRYSLKPNALWAEACRDLAELIWP